MHYIFMESKETAGVGEYHNILLSEVGFLKEAI